MCVLQAIFNVRTYFAGSTVTEHAYKLCEHTNRIVWLRLQYKTEHFSTVTTVTVYNSYCKLYIVYTIHIQLVYDRGLKFNHNVIGNTQ